MATQYDVFWSSIAMIINACGILSIVEMWNKQLVSYWTWMARKEMRKYSNIHMKNFLYNPVVPQGD